MFIYLYAKTKTSNAWDFPAHKIFPAITFYLISVESKEQIFEQINELENKTNLYSVKFIFNVSEQFYIVLSR